MYIKLFEEFHSLNESKTIAENEYVKLSMAGKNLVIELADDIDREDFDDMVKNSRFGDDAFYDMFDTIRANSDLEYVENLGDVGAGITEAPGIVQGASMDRNGQMKITKRTKIWYYDDYAINSFVEQLQKHGKVVFQAAD